MEDNHSYHDLVSDLERKYNNLISVADAMDSICKKLGCHQGIAAELILSRLPGEYDVMGKPANALFFGKRVGLSTFKYYENSPSIRVMLMRAIEKDITILKKKLTQEYKDFVFIKADLEECLGFSFDNPSELRADPEFHSDSDQTKIAEPLELFKVIQSFKTENEKLKQALAATKLNLPILLGRYRDDDPLLLAIQLRNIEWHHYDEHDRRTIPTQAALVAQLQEKYGKEQMPEVQAKAIEKVACPIKR